MPTQQPARTEPELLNAVQHVVHDFANLVSSGSLVVTGGPAGQRLDPPLNSHVGEAFLLNCRKMYEFFLYPRFASKRQNNDDVGAAHYLQHLSTPLTFQLPTWDRLHEQMNKQLLHVTFNRETVWDGHQENADLLNEFTTVWKAFRANLIEPFKSKFDSEIAAKKQVLGFHAVDLG